MTRIHLIGIGGTGLSAIARVLLEMGHTVSGSDRAKSSFTRDLQSAGVTIKHRSPSRECPRCRPGGALIRHPG